MNVGQLHPLLSDSSPILNFVRLIFKWLKNLSPMGWLAKFGRKRGPESKLSLFRSRSELTSEELRTKEFIRERVQFIDYYVIAWLLLELFFVILACLDCGPGWFRVIVAIIAITRIIEIVQVNVNTTVFDYMSGRSDEEVASKLRMVVLSGVNYLELIICFGLIYAVNVSEIGSKQPVLAFYLSLITQLTIGYGDVHPLGWLRVVAAIQGLASLLFIVLVFGRFIASLPNIKEAFHESTLYPGEQNVKTEAVAVASAPASKDSDKAAKSFWIWIARLSGLATIVGIPIAIYEINRQVHESHQQSVYQSWELLNTAQGKPGDGGRGKALTFLIADSSSLDNLDLSRSQLDGIRLDHADMREINFTEAKLRKADFSQSKLSRAIFCRARLGKAVFENAILDDADFADAWLPEANFRMARLQGANFRGAKLPGADLRGAIIFETDFTGAVLRSAILKGLDLQSAIGLTVEQVEAAVLDSTTLLPPEAR